MFNKFISLFLIICFSCSICFADCDWKTIKAQPDGTFTYTQDCHLKVGELVKEAQLREEQVKKLNEAIALQDLEISKLQDRINLWKDTTYKLEDKLISNNNWGDYSKSLYFGLGVLTTVLSGYAVGAANRK